MSGKLSVTNAHIERVKLVREIGKLGVVAYEPGVPGKSRTVVALVSSCLKDARPCRLYENVLLVSKGTILFMIIDDDSNI